MSSWAATRRASSESLTVQQPAVGASPEGPCHILRVAPMTSWPSSFIRAAATDESTPPDIATSTLIELAFQGLDHEFGGVLGFGHGRGPSEGEPHRMSGLFLAEAHRRQHMGDGGGARLAGRSGRGGDSESVEPHQQRFVLDLEPEMAVLGCADAFRNGALDSIGQAWLRRPGGLRRPHCRNRSRSAAAATIAAAMPATPATLWVPLRRPYS